MVSKIIILFSIQLLKAELSEIFDPQLLKAEPLEKNIWPHIQDECIVEYLFGFLI